MLAACSSAPRAPVMCSTTPRRVPSAESACERPPPRRPA
jgi:hypothetical protein